MRHLSLAPVTVVLLGMTFSCIISSEAKPPTKRPTAVKNSGSDRKAVIKAIHAELSLETSAHMKVQPFSIAKLDVQNDWALANITPANRARLDAFKMLLHKQKGQWKYVTLGTNFQGAGKQFFVPKKYWKKWAL